MRQFGGRFQRADPSGTDLTSAHRYSGRSVSVVVGNGAVSAALVYDEIRKIALAIVCSLEFRIVSGVAELSVRLRTVTTVADARSRFGPGFTWYSRRSVDSQLGGCGRFSRARIGERETGSRGRAHGRPCCSGSGYPPAAPRCWWPPPIRFHKISPSVRSCGWRRSPSTCSRSYWHLKATDSTRRTLFAIAAGLFAPVACAFRAYRSGSRCGRNCWSI